MKEKIGMEKLIELLNEYEKHISLGGLADWREFDGNLHYYSNYKDEYVFDNVYYRIISKNYGFIKWLVENDKIDKDKLYKSEYKPYFWNRKTNAFSGFWAENTLLMLLSISSSPIEDLLLYLK